jgi:2-dehydro-3-deoxyphosphogalactonate aldolase
MNETVPWPKLERQLVAILRGIRPEECAEIVAALVGAGFEAIEIPLNSPDPFRSIEIAREVAPANCFVGAGTVLTVADVEKLDAVGGNLMVSPNVDASVISCAAGLGMVTMPGVFTPTEALAAVKAGASALKFFPASVLGPAGITAIRAVLPSNIEVAAVGGVSETSFADYAQVGIDCFGLGSSLYKAGRSAAEVGERAEKALAAYDAVFKGVITT